MISLAWDVSIYSMALTGFFAMLIFASAIADILKLRHGFSDSLFLVIIVCFGLFGAISIISAVAAMILSALWIIYIT